jgi:hypothetical protein
MRVIKKQYWTTSWAVRYEMISTSTSLRTAFFIGLAIELSRVGSHAAEKAGFSIRVGLYIINNPQRRSL